MATSSSPASSTSTTAATSAMNAQAAYFLASGSPTVAGAVPPPPAVPPPSAVPSQGRSPIVVPSFVTTFAPPVASPAAPNLSDASTPSLPSWALPSVNMAANDLLPLPTFQQPFVVGPGFSPIPAKLVTQIVSGKFTDLTDLLADNLAIHEPEPQLMFDGRLIFTSTPKRQRRRIDDVVSWIEAFAIYSLVLTSFFPSRWRDLTAYNLLILRTYRQFNGCVWLSYDQAFREHAAATKLADWSTMNVQLYNFHAAGASVRSSPTAASSSATEAAGSPSSQTVCKSWNNGRCIARNPSCKFAHQCSRCSADHRARDCSWASGSTSHQRPRSLSPESFKRQKR